MSLCDKCIHRDVCGDEDLGEGVVKVCLDFIDKSILSVPESTDLISRDELINEILTNFDMERCDYTADEFIGIIVSLPSAVPKREKVGWISVSERLPKISDVYRVTRRLFDNRIDTEPYYIVDACFFDGSDTWHNDNRINHERGYADDVIAWQENPEPYKAEREDKE